MKLAGARIALTRPQGLDAPWADVVRAAGGHPCLYPLLQLHATGQPLPAAAAEADGLIFISPAAVGFALAELRAAGLPRPEQILAAPGAGTAAALERAGLKPIMYPLEDGDSEALLRCLPVSPGQHWLLVRGEGGRQVLDQGLLQQGARLSDWRLYRRDADQEQLQRLLQDLPQLDALLLTSSETLRTLFAHAGESQRQQLQSKPLLVLHPRIAATARQLGVQRLALCAGAADLPAALAGIADVQQP